MKKAFFIPVILFFILNPVFAQDRVELFGYFESQFMGSRVNKTTYQLQSNKLRVDLKSSLLHLLRDGELWFIHPFF